MLRTCDAAVKTFISHTVEIPECCPVSHNPRPGSVLTVSYFPDGVVVPVENLVDWVNEYVGGHDTRRIRNMEEMVQDIAVRCAEETRVRVRLRANLIIQPPYGGELQTMRVSARA